MDKHAHRIWTIYIGKFKDPKFWFKGIGFSLVIPLLLMALAIINLLYILSPDQFSQTTNCQSSELQFWVLSKAAAMSAGLALIFLNLFILVAPLSKKDNPWLYCAALIVFMLVTYFFWVPILDNMASSLALPACYKS